MVSLFDVKKSCWVKIEKICLADECLISKLESIGLISGQEVFVENDYPNQDLIALIINDVTYMLRRNDTKQILVSLI